MELGSMRLRCCPQAPPNKIKPLPRTISAGARRLCSRRRRAGALLHVAAPDSRPLETVCADSTGQGTKPRDDDKFCLVEMEVRDCELDQYGLVSSDVYVDYLENGRQHCNMGCASASRSIITSPISFLFLLGSYLAREVFASRLGIGRDSIARTGNALALSEQKLNYYTPLKRGARFVVMVRVVQIKGARMVLEHFVETLPPERKLVLEATATVVFLDKDYRPTRVFPEVASKMRLHFF
ncbi:acyl-acyl carrier protein thioesterase ATL4, chloroplastic isoform X2 [Zea mays]|uniref:acyl-acyl carrier protein thioesterase ATL4, chloroplastic isoform X2 n=1 Tax=Zea mays TaxID=4577 RepID=UPI0004DE82E4|nr:acyl-acyl carrier protein thioesterase ATL4, chloroplastic isoform X2 [Zea mays]